MDAKSFAIGFIAAIILVLMWKFFTGKRSSSFETNVFANVTNSDAAQKIFNQTQVDIKNKYDALIKDAQDNGRDAKPMIKEASQALQDLAGAYNEWSLEHSVQVPSPRPAPAPSPSK